MKHKTAITLLAILIMLSFTSVWANEITVGSGETTSTSHLPIYAWDEYSYSQQIYTAAWIGSAMEITKIKFYWVSGANENSNDWTIYMGNTSQTGFSVLVGWIPVTSMTQVFSGNLSLPSVEGWWEITLDSAFMYNGTDNLVIAIDENSPGNCSTPPGAEWRSFGTDIPDWGKGPSEAKSSIYYANDGPVNNPDPANPPSVLDEMIRFTNVINQIILVDSEVTLPIELSSFTAVATQQNYVSLNWVTQTETNICGYYIYRSESNALGTAMRVSPLISATNSSTESRYSFLDTEVSLGTWYYWLQSIEYMGDSDYYGYINVNIADNGENTCPDIPLITSINKVYPNPFNPVTTISYSLTKEENVNISIYNLKGELVKVLLSESKQCGSHKIVWNGLDSNNRALGSGTYIIRMIAGEIRCSQKAMLMK